MTTDPAYYEEHAESVALWSPGNPLFVAPELPGGDDDADDAPDDVTTLAALLER